MYLGPERADYRKNFVYEVPTLFQMMQRLNGNAPMGALMDLAILTSASTTIFNSISTQLILQMLMNPNNGTTVIGSINSVQSRLWVQPVATGVLCAVFVLMAGISTVLMFIRPWNVAIREPGSVLATTELLASSPDLRNILTGFGHAPLSRARKALNGWLFVTCTHPEMTSSGVQVTARYEKITEESQGLVPETAITWWRPFASRSWFHGLAVAVPLLMIAFLEAIQRISDKQQGFVNIHTQRSLSLSTYLPAFLAICLRLMYSSLESIAAVFSPFTAMNPGPAPTSRSLSLNYLTKAGPHAWFVSLTKRHYALTAILTANFLAAFLTIVVSGLYSESMVPFTASISLRQIDEFNLSKSSIGFEDNMAGAITNLITYTNASFPSWTSNSLVFPTLDIDNVTNVLSGNDTTPATIRVKTRSTRASLNCTSEFKPNAIWANIDKRETKNLKAAGMARLNLNTSLPWSSCDRPPFPLPPSPNWGQFYDVPNDTTISLFGTATVLQWNEERNYVSGNGLVPTGGGYSTPYLITPGGEAMLDPMSGRGCPSFSMVLGTASVGPSASNKTEWSVYAADVGMLVCWQNFHEIETDLTLHYPGLDMPVDEPPKPNEQSEKALWNGTSGPSFEFNINNLFITLRRTKTATEEAQNATIDEYHLDKFIRALADG
jgi:hypothetical protein